MAVLTLLSKIALHLLAMDGDKTPWQASAKATLTLPFPDAFPDVPVLGHTNFASGHDCAPLVQSWDIVTKPHLLRDHHKVQTTDAMGSHQHEERSLRCCGLHFDPMVMEN
jgi:hypothetical protein